MQFAFKKTDFCSKKLIFLKLNIMMGPLLYLHGKFYPLWFYERVGPGELPKKLCIKKIDIFTSLFLNKTLKIGNIPPFFPQKAKEEKTIFKGP